MSILHLVKPQLRPFLRNVKSPDDVRQCFIVDRLGLSRPLTCTLTESAWLAHLDGTRTLQELPGCANVPIEDLHRFIARLEQNLMLNSPRFLNAVNAPDRPPRCIGCYEGDPTKLRQQLQRLFARGAGHPRPTKPDGSLRAALIPHIDFARGGLSYTYAFKEIFEKSDASLFVIVGTSHHSTHRFTLTRKNFQTPLGTTKTDQSYIDRLVKRFGKSLFDDEWLAHIPEHSIELEVVFLQYLYQNVRPIRIVPLVVGSYHDCVHARVTPHARPEIAALVAALKAVEAEANEPVCYLISGDLAHIGPKFDPLHHLDESTLRYSHAQDQALLHHAAALDLDGYFRVIANEQDNRNICGLPPTFAALAAAEPHTGKVLHYERYIDPRGNESVSFASMGFYR
jgi:AmmeMemoRadiSam system protein B